jgi:predicted dehydrogenase
MAFGIAVLGLDHWYTAFGVLDICATSTDTPLVSIYEPDAARRAEVAAAYPHALVTDSAEAALSAPGVELAAICAKTGDAVSLSKQSLNAGKHVVSVKPFARTMAEADDILAVAVASGKFFGSFEGMQRFQPRAETLRDLIASGVVGDVVAFHQVGHGGLPSPWRGETSGDPSWWLDPEQVPGGAWIDHSIYAVDLARFALGGEITHATGVLDKRVHKHLPLEDFGAATMTLTRGASPDVTLYILDTWCAEPGTGYSEYRFIGTRGTITADGNAWVVKTKDGSTRHEWPSGTYFRFDRLAALLGSGQPTPFGPDDARANLAACLQVYGGSL